MAKLPSMRGFDYPAHLAMMGERAKAPREPDAPTVISTFAGGGGSSTGYHMAGFHELLAVEWDDNAVQTLRANYPDLDVYHGDIAKLSVEDVLTRTGLKVGELDLFDGSPPCQGFSTAGKRDFGDDRNQMFREYVRLLRGLRPKVFVMENVSGMVKGKMKIIFAEILQELRDSGYKVSARLLNAKYFHVPQSRQRMIFIGVRDDLGIEPSHPKAESGVITGVMLNYGKPMWNIDFVYKPIDREFPTITKTETMSHSVFKNGGAVPMSVPQLCCVQSFPSNYIFSCRSKAINRLGNSVPPLMVEAIARHIRNEILDKTD